MLQKEAIRGKYMHLLLCKYGRPFKHAWEENALRHSDNLELRALAQTMFLYPFLLNKNANSQAMKQCDACRVLSSKAPNMYRKPNRSCYPIWTWGYEKRKAQSGVRAS